MVAALATTLMLNGWPANLNLSCPLTAELAKIPEAE
jgi:hypothetical protein